MRQDRTADNILATGSAFSRGIATYYQGKSQAQLARSNPKAFLQYKNQQTRIGMIMLFVFLGLFVLMIIIMLIFVTRSSKKIDSGEHIKKNGWFILDPLYDKIILTHDAGFFSCLNIQLLSIIEYYNIYKKWPKIIDSSQQFKNYKLYPNHNIFFEIFEYPSQYNLKSLSIIKKKNIKFSCVHQFLNYHTELDYKSLSKIVRVYFDIKKSFVINYIDYLIIKYKINLQKSCFIRFRGNDKIKETKQPRFEDVIYRATKLTTNGDDGNKKKNEIRFIVQTDVLEFFEKFHEKFPKAIRFNEILIIKKNDQESIQNLFSGHMHLKSTFFYIASIYIMSLCKFIICTSGNGEIFSMLWRGNSKNVQQFLNDKWYVS